MDPVLRRVEHALPLPGEALSHWSFTLSPSPSPPLSALPRHVEPVLRRVEHALSLLGEALALVRVDGGTLMPLARVALSTLTVESMPAAWQVKAAGGCAGRGGGTLMPPFTLIAEDKPEVWPV